MFSRVCIAYAQMHRGSHGVLWEAEDKGKAFHVSLQAQLSCLNPLLHIIFYTWDIADGEREAGRKDAAARTVITCGW